VPTGKVRCPAYLLIGRGLTSGSETEQGLERGHRLPPAIVTKDEFVEINLELITAYAVIGSDQPLLQVANSAVCQRHHRLSPSTQLDSQGLAARNVLEPSFLQPVERGSLSG
jgi:hypothetical protein